MPVLLDIDKLLHGRLRAVQAMLKPLAQAGRPIPCAFVPTRKAEISKIICAHGGGHVEDYTNIWFPTNARGVQAQYHEVWYPREEESEWVLERAYFSLRRTFLEITKIEEILCLHSDPLCADPEPLGSYKRGPHLHVSLAPAPIGDAHFPLNLQQLNEVLASCDNLSESLALAICVIQHEIIAKL